MIYESASKVLFGAVFIGKLGCPLSFFKFWQFGHNTTQIRLVFQRGHKQDLKPFYTVPEAELFELELSVLQSLLDSSCCNRFRSLVLCFDRST